MSDSTRSRWGARKPWLIVGALLLALSVIQLYGPTSDVGAGYYLGWFVAFYLGFSLIEIPYKGWGTELARGYLHPARLATAVAVMFVFRNLLFAPAPYVPVQDRKSTRCTSIPSCASR